MKKILTLILLLSSLTLVADTYFLHTLKGKKTDLIHAANQLIHASLQEKDLVLAKKPGNAIFEFKGTIINLGKATVIQLKRLEDGKVMRSAKVKITKIENLDKAVDLLVNKLVPSKSFSAQK